MALFRNLIRILLVEDDLEDAALLEAALADAGAGRFLPVHVRGLADAREALGRGGIDVVLLDLSLRDSRPAQTLRALRRHGFEAPVVVLTGMDDEEMALEAVRFGAQDYLVKGSIDGATLRRSIRFAIERHQLLLALRAGAMIDELTGLYNRRGFNALASAQLKHGARKRRPACLLYADVDGLKPINDAFGHPAGDEMLREVARALQDTFRESDVLARVGGDEFVILAVEASDAEIDLLMARLHERVGAIRGPGLHRPSLSVGAVCYDPMRPRPLDELMTDADAAMYEAKRRRYAAAPSGGAEGG